MHIVQVIRPHFFFSSLISFLLLCTVSVNLSSEPLNDFPQNGPDDQSRSLLREEEEEKRKKKSRSAGLEGEKKGKKKGLPVQ